jgi:Fic family protein
MLFSGIPRMSFTPHFSITSETAKALMAIEASRAAVDRLPMTTMILHRCGYGLKGLYSLEEYARNLRGYYDALTVGPSHNYHLGRAESDVSGFVQFFCEGMADAFAKVRFRAQTVGASITADEAGLLRELRPLQRQALGLFVQSRVVTTSELAAYLGISQRQSRDQCVKWVEEGFLVIENPSNKARSYRLAERFEQGVV